MVLLPCGGGGRESGNTAWWWRGVGWRGLCCGFVGDLSVIFKNPGSYVRNDMVMLRLVLLLLYPNLT